MNRVRSDAWMGGPEHRCKKRRTYDATGKEPDEEVIDHIYLKGENIRVVDGGIIEMEKPLADHCPIWAVLRIPSNTKQRRRGR